MTEEHTKAVWTYRGRRLLVNGKLAQFFINEEEKPVAFQAPIIPRYASPGSRWEFTFVGENFFTKGPNAPKFVGYIESKNQRAEWELEARTDEVEYARKRREKEDQKLLLERRLAPIRARYKKLWMAPDSQAALLAAVIREITS